MERVSNELPFRALSECEEERGITGRRRRRRRRARVSKWFQRVARYFRVQGWWNKAGRVVRAMFMPRYYAICVLVASNLLRSLLVVNVWQMCEEGRRSEGLPTEGGREDKWRWKGSGVVAIRSELSTLFKEETWKVKWYGKMESPSFDTDICAKIRDWRDEVYHYLLYSSPTSLSFLETSKGPPFETISSILAELTFALPLHFAPSPICLITLFPRNKWREYRGRRGRIIAIPRESKRQNYFW